MKILMSVILFTSFVATAQVDEGEILEVQSSLNKMIQESSDNYQYIMEKYKEEKNNNIKVKASKTITVLMDVGVITAGVAAFHWDSYVKELTKYMNELGAEAGAHKFLSKPNEDGLKGNILKRAKEAISRDVTVATSSPHPVTQEQMRQRRVGEYEANRKRMNKNRLGNNSTAVLVTGAMIAFNALVFSRFESSDEVRSEVNDLQEAIRKNFDGNKPLVAQRNVNYLNKEAERNIALRIRLAVEHYLLKEIVDEIAGEVIVEEDAQSAAY